MEWGNGWEFEKHDAFSIIDIPHSLMVVFELQFGFINRRYLYKLDS